MTKILILTIFSSLLFSCSKNIYSKNEEFIRFKNTGKHISVKLKINQYKKGNFYFDTASPWFVIDSTFYKNQKISFKIYSKDENIGVGNNPSKLIRVHDTINFSINKNTFFSKKNMIYNLKKGFGKNIDGIVGFNNFDDTPFEVNYLEKKITFNPKINDSYNNTSLITHIKI